MHSSSILIAFATLLPLACSNGGAGDGGSGVCGGSESSCTSLTDCCTGFQCEASKCVFVGGNGGNGGNGNSGSGSSRAASSSGTGSNASSGFGSSSGTQASGSSSGSKTLDSTGGTTSRAGSSSGATSRSSTGGTTVRSSSGSSSGASGGSSPDLCALCTSANCAGVNDLCVCDPDDANCTNYYCAGNCMNPTTGLADQAVCPSVTTCVAATDSQGSMTDYVCLPSPGTCIKGGSSSGGSSGGSSSHSGSGSSSGGSSGGSSPDLCFMCGNSTNCSASTDLCVCDPDDGSCTDGFCAGNCENGSVGDQALCPKGTTCVQTMDWQTESITEFVCYPADGTCLDAGV